jgi:hypothetical protein
MSAKESDSFGDINSSNLEKQDELNILKTTANFALALREQIELIPQINSSLLELRQVILDKYPTAIFAVTFGLEDPFGIQLRPIIAVEQDEVLDSCMDKLLEIQVEKHLPIHVFPESPKVDKFLF